MFPNDPTYWRNGLQGIFPEGGPPLGEPQPGYYMHITANKQSVVPVFFWYSDNGTTGGFLRCRIGTDQTKWEINEHKALEIWPFCHQRPITLEEYKKVLNGAEFARHDPITTEVQVRHGDNKPDDYQLLKDQINEVLERADTYTEIKDDDQAVRAQGVRSKLRELFNEGEKQRKAEKKPHDDAAKEVQKKWTPILDKAESGADKLRKAIEAWENKKLAEATAAAEKAILESKDIALAHLDPTPYEPKIIKPPVGRGVTPKKRKIAYVKDWKLVFEKFQHRHEIQVLLQKLAQNYVDDGFFDCPGIEIREEIKI
jgi:hypothetical protein